MMDNSLLCAVILADVRSIFQLRCWNMSNSVESSYDVIAGEYAKHYADELTRKPFDRKMLDWLIEKVGTLGGICDLGCGPGQIAAYLASRGTTVCGIDLSEEMVRTARRLNPGLLFEQGTCWTYARWRTPPLGESPRSTRLFTSVVPT
jgi:SAM-dependent methyltransferase